MALEVEDGSGKANAESYASVSEADTYHGNRGNTAWDDATTAQKEQALRKASDYLVAVYREKWQGIRVSRTQALDWPRKGVITEDYYEPVSGPRPSLWPDLAYEVPEDSVPPEVKNATMMLALKALSADLIPDIDSSAKVKREKVGPIETEYMDDAPAATFYRQAHGALKPLLRRGGGMTGQLIRA